MDAITFIPDESRREPLYLQVYKHLTERIRDGELRDGQHLPSKRALAAHLKISVSTVETAYEMLVTQGYATARPRSGYYVNGIEGLVADRPYIVPEEEPERFGASTYRYDFGTVAVDASAFPYATWGKITREVMSDGGGLLARGDVRGDECLRMSIAKYLRDFRNVRCRPDQIVVGAGMEYLMGLIAGLTEGTFALEEPGYSATARILENLGASVCPILLDDGGMDEHALYASGATAAYITPSHQFPTGIVMPVARRLRLIQWAAQESERFLIEDDYDSEFRYSGRPVPSLQGMDPSGKVVYIGSFSRSIAPSIRIAYMVLPHDMMDRFLKKYGSYSSTVSRFEQHTLSRFISEGHFARHINRTRLVYRRRRDAAIRALQSMESGAVTVHGAQAGIHLIAELRCGFSAQQVAAAAAAHSVRVLPLADYYHGPSPESARDRMVLHFAGMDEETICDGITCLDRAVLGLQAGHSGHRT